MAARKARRDGRETPAERKRDASLGRRALARAQSRSGGNAAHRNEGRVQGFLAGLGATALIWLLTARASS